MADDVEHFIFAPAQLASQKSEFFEEVYFRRRACMAAFNLASNMASELLFQAFLEFTDKDIREAGYKVNKVVFNSYSHNSM